MMTTFLEQTETLLTLSSHMETEDSFICSPSYFMLTGRKGTWVYKDGAAQVVVCVHPNVNDRLLVFPALGPDACIPVARLLGWLPLPHNGVQLARFTRPQLQRLTRLLKQEDYHHVTGITQISETVLDWMYPVHVLDTARVAACDGPAFRNVRQKCRKIDPTKADIMPLQHDRALQNIRACVKMWESSLILKSADYNDANSAYYACLVESLTLFPHLFDGYILLYEGRVRGFTIWDRPLATESEKDAPTIVNLLANITDHEIPGLSEFQLVQTCRILHDNGIARLNRGGSETETLDKFKQKFDPVKSYTLYSADVQYRRWNDVFDMQTLVPSRRSVLGQSQHIPLPQREAGNRALQSISNLIGINSTFGV